MLPILQLRKNRDRSVLRLHPWIFSGSVLRHPECKNGSIVEVQTATGKTLGYGFYSEKSQIRCRIFAFSYNKIDSFPDSFWFEKIEHAAHLRKNLIKISNTNCFRLLNAEGDFFPGLIIDIYGPVAVLQFLCKGTELISGAISAALCSLGYNLQYLKNPNRNDGIEDIALPNGWLCGDVPDFLMVQENGLRFYVDIIHGNKTGFFMDQRENRNLLRSITRNRQVLNTFSYTGGFSVYALAGGASFVQSVDISDDAVNQASRNVLLNFPDPCHEALAADCFEYLRTVEPKRFDIIILDPPAFAKNSRSVPSAARGYKDINLLAIKKIKPGGIIFTFSCSQHISQDLFQKIIFSAALDSGRKVRILRHLFQAPDHPVNIYHPEGAYLKGFMLAVDSDPFSL